MNAQSAKTPTSCESVTITLTPEEQEMLVGIFNRIDPDNAPQPSKADIFLGVRRLECDELIAFHKKLLFLFSNIGDACATPAHIPEAPGQGGFICYECENRVSYLFDDSRCKDCTRLTPGEVQGNVGQGGNQ
ncbi:MAG: hypothetical protein WC504_01980 [Methylobacter sp.]